MADELDRTGGFFIMYGESIKTLQDELVSVLGIALARSFLFRFGFKCGHVTAREMGLKAQGSQAIEYLGEIWMEMGLARPIKIKKKKAGLYLELKETLETSYRGDKSCDFTRGFLAGLMSSIANVPHHCVEEECVSKGAEACVFVIAEEKR